ATECLKHLRGDIGSPQILLGLEVSLDCLYCFEQECPRSTSRIEEVDLGVRDSPCSLEVTPQNVVDRRNYVPDYRCWSVENPSSVANLGIINRQERLVEVDHWILFS